MTDDGNRTRPRTTRRGVLALVGAAALSGCGSLPLVGGNGGTELDAAALDRVTEKSTPRVTEPLPVEVASSHVAASRERAESALASVPLPLSREELPNGAMREEIGTEAEHAREALSIADGDVSTRQRLERLRDARESARYVAAAWGYTTGEVTPADVRERRRSVREDVRSFTEGWEYVGSDPVRALLVHDTVTSWTEEARRIAERDRGSRPVPRPTPTETGDGAQPPTPTGTGDGAQPPTPVRPLPERTNALTVGERAGEVEIVRAHLDDARHVGERFVASLSDPASIRPTLVDARESLASTLADRLADVPGSEVHDPNEMVDVDRDLVESPAGRALEGLHERLPIEREQDEGPATGVLERATGLVAVDAFGSLRQRIADGERFGVESVADVRDLRSAAVTAIEDALAGSPDRRLARRLLAGELDRLSFVDEELRRYSGSVAVDSISYEVGGYLAVAELARAVPDACTTTLDALGVPAET